MKTISAAIAVAASLAVAAGAQAAPVLFTGNGHYYEFVGGYFSWSDALAAADAQTLTLGSDLYDGYLATVTSAAENSFLTSVNGDGWIAGSDVVSEGVWKWMAGPETGVAFYTGGPGGTTLTYSSWNLGEPNNSGDEDYLQLNGGGWNDLPNGSNRGYFVEYSLVNANAAIPEPASWAMMIAGFGALGAVVRRRRAAIA